MVTAEPRPRPPTREHPDPAAETANQAADLQQWHLQQRSSGRLLERRLLLRLTALVTVLWVLAVGSGALLNNGALPVALSVASTLPAPTPHDFGFTRRGVGPGKTAAVPHPAVQSIARRITSHDTSCHLSGCSGIPPDRAKLPLTWFDRLMRSYGPLLPVPVLLLRWCAATARVYCTPLVVTL